ncbi:hypothetical protein GV64_06100 [Endozoicomonas elysicola]|uniref:Uncharacterized protein n=2 Tax=Endozoicomonas elysicola TaxID=305900 RepID=A0A081K879_9GAMM|nr:hypothetical protein GV64_06100 [Endozoicomonas elysicola]
MCPYIEKTPVGVYMQNQESPKQFNRLMLDVLSRVASHAPGLLLAYYQHGIAYNLLVPLAGFALWDVGISVGNYLRPDRVTPDSATPGFLVDFLGSAYQSIYGIAVAASTAAQFKAGLIFPALFAWKYLTRAQTVNIADIAYYRNRIAFKSAPANSLVNKIARYNGRLRMCTNVGSVNKASTNSLVQFVVDHKRDNVALMRHVYPRLDPCRNIEQLNDREQRTCHHILKVQNLYERIRKPNIRSRFKSSHRSARGVVATLIHQDLGLSMTLLRPQTNLVDEIFEDTLVSEDGWRMLEFSDYDDYQSTADLMNDYFQYLITVVGNKKYYIFLGMEVRPVVDDDGIMTNTLVYLSPFGSISQHPSMVAIPVEFNNREDVFRFAEALIGMFDGNRQRVLLFKIGPSEKISSLHDHAPVLDEEEGG